jgi:hypothetical protein
MIYAHLPFWAGTYETTHVFRQLFAPDLQPELVLTDDPCTPGYIISIVGFALDLHRDRQQLVYFNYHVDCDADGGRVIGARHSDFTAFLLSRVVDVFGGWLVNEEGDDVLRTAVGLRLPRRTEGERCAWPVVERQLDRWRFNSDEIVILERLCELHVRRL